MDSPVKIDNRGSLEIVTLNRPDRQNAIDVDMANALTDYFSALPHRLDVRVVILRSDGKHFSAGADLDSPAFVPPGSGRTQKQMGMQHLYSGVVRLMRQCPQPIIALIQGAAVGGGFSLALAADVRIASPDARMNAAYLRIGLGGCDMGSGYLLPRLVGVSVASELLLSGNFINAERALTTGLISQIIDRNDLLESGLKLANDMLQASPMGLRMTKETLNGSLSVGSLEAGLMLEDRQQVMLLDTDDHREAVNAFKEKRKPVYKNC
jgi:enoyl-CoA hydratase/carnithine racemase